MGKLSQSWQGKMSPNIYIGRKHIFVKVKFWFNLREAAVKKDVYKIWNTLQEKFIFKIQIIFEVSVKMYKLEQQTKLRGEH